MDKDSSRKKIAFCPDIAFNFNPDNGCETSQPDLNLPKPVIAVTVRHWDFPDITDADKKKKAQQDYIASLIDTCETLFNAWRCSILIFPQTRGPGIFEDDTDISKEVFETLKHIIPAKNLLFIDLSVTASPLHVIQMLSRVDLVITTRFHAAIFALSKGVPVISITYQPKSLGIMAHMDLDQFCVGISEIDPDRIRNLVERILNQYSYYQHTIQKNITNIRRIIDTELGDVVSSFSN